MVEQVYNLDMLFGALSDSTRRDILLRIRSASMNVSALADNYRISLAGVAKHIAVMERAGLVHKTRQGKEQLVTVNPEALLAMNAYIEAYQQLWNRRLDSLGRLLASTKQGE